MSYSKMVDFIIYKVISPSGRIYIGLTKQGLEKRKSDHFSEAKTSKSNRKFHNAISKYGESLKWEIIKIGLSKNLAQLYEMYYIKKYNSYKKGYNSTLGGELNLGIKRTQEQIDHLSKKTSDYFKNNPEARKNLSDKHKKLHNDPSFKKKHSQRLKRVHGTKEARLQNAKNRGGKPFNVYNLITKEFVKTYEIITDANLELGLPNGKVSWCLSGKRNHCKTYIFKYLDDPTVDGIKYNLEWDKSIKRIPNGTKRKKETKT